MSVTQVLTKESVLQALDQVHDPEVRLPIRALNLLDDVVVSDGQVTVRFHLTTPFCPAEFAASIAADVKRQVGLLPGVSGVEVELLGHYSAREINRRVNGDTWDVHVPGSTEEARPAPFEAVESKESLSWASVRRLRTRLERATRSEYRVRWAIQGLQRFRDAMGIADLDEYVVSCKTGRAAPDAALDEFCDRLRLKGYPTTAIAGLCSGPKLWLLANGVRVGQKLTPDHCGQRDAPLPFHRMLPNMRFGLLALISADLDVTELMALRLTDLGQWDGRLDVLPDVTAHPLAARIRAEVAKDSRERITFLSYDAQRALMDYQGQIRAPALADASRGLFSPDDTTYLKRLSSNLIRVSNEANVFLCTATAEALGKAYLG